MLGVTCKPLVLSVTHKPFMLSIVMLSVIMLSVVMLNVEAPVFKILEDAMSKGLVCRRKAHD
jgi:hypothetical protein